MSTKVLVVDDTIVFRRVVSEALARIPGMEIAGTAGNGKLALARIASLQPDLVTLDIEMPEMNGIEVLQAIAAMRIKPGVIVLSAQTVRGGELTMKALDLGAFDFITKPDGGSPEENIAHLTGQLQPMIRAYERLRQIRSLLHTQPGEKPAASTPIVAAYAPAQPPAAPPRQRARNGAPIVLIAVSTGGPPALAKLLPALPANLGAPVFIVQHLPALFTQPLAASLNAKCALEVCEGKDGQRALPNHVYIAPGGRHMKLAPGPEGEIVIKITDDAPENNCRPAADVLFRSAALHFPGRAVAAIMTGMGNDGTAGLRLLKRGGCFSIAQDEHSCVVFGMPKEAIQANLADFIVPLDQIAPAILRGIREAAL